jgi:S-adenosylmethionine synthetase
MSRELCITTCADPAADPVEIVERKGLGHPDTICDALAEELSCALSQRYRERFGFVLHHNVDKVLLWGGASRAAFGGGEVLAPIEIFLSGRATREFKGVTIPIEEIAVETAKAWLRAHLSALDVDRHVKIHSLIRPGSAELVDLFARQRESGTWLSNDTSIGVGYAPQTRLEAAVLGVEHDLNSPFIKRRHPAFGEDVKVMGVRRADDVDLTVSCAFVGRYVADLDDYVAGRRPNVAVNAADDVARGAVYLTVTGTSAEAGDDGEAGRGNRANGLITPHRPMTMESVAGKNPVTHVGKLYNVAARRIAAQIVQTVPGIAAAECYLVSRIGAPVREPQIVELRLCDREARPEAALRPALTGIVDEQLAALDGIWEALLARQISLY